MSRAPLSLSGLLLLACLASSPTRSDELKDLYFGEALYYAHQGDFFAALERLDLLGRLLRIAPCVRLSFLVQALGIHH